MTPPRNRDTLDVMSSPTIWSLGRYEAVGDRIAPIAAEVVAAANRCGRVGDGAVVDLACGTGNAALAAAAEGARVTAVDVTPELIAIGAQKAEKSGQSITWVTADAADTGLPGGSFDAVVSNMGIIFVEPVRQVAEIARLLKPGGVPGVLVVGARPRQSLLPARSSRSSGRPRRRDTRPTSGATRTRSPTDWRPTFDDVHIETASHTWHLGTIDEAVHFMSP